MSEDINFNCKLGKISKVVYSGINPRDGSVSDEFCGDPTLNGRTDTCSKYLSNDLALDFN